VTQHPRTATRPCRVVELGAGPDPEAVFRVVAEAPGAVFLDSAGGPPHLARWSMLASRPVAVLEATGRDVTETRDGKRVTSSANPFSALRAALAAHGCGGRRRAGGVPFVSGAVGYLGYELKHAVERLPHSATHDQRFADMRFGFYDSALCFDHENATWYATGRTDAHVDERKRELEAASQLPPVETPELRATSGFTCNMSRTAYLNAVTRIKEYIAAGDIFQANFTRRFEARLETTARELYLALRRNNPAPFAAYLDCGRGRVVASSSPERFIELRGTRVETRPIKGTRPRGATPDEDEANARALQLSAKDAAELAMIVDLERNDLGRVADYGTVVVSERKALEAYETVFHLVATVEGRLAEHKDCVDLLKATFPGGSITGAPKVRAMEIIEELEPTARSVYTGSIGYIDGCGDVDLNIVIRTILYDRGRVTYQVGGGIVADSEPEAEYDETLAKGKALARTIAGPQGFRE